jgi:hypothetical protein
MGMSVYALNKMIFNSTPLTLWVKQLAIRLGCKIPQPSRWLSRLRERGCYKFTIV